MFQTDKVNSPAFEVVRLSSLESICNFDCGDADLNDFILNRAVLFDKYMSALLFGMNLAIFFVKRRTPYAY